MDLDRSIDVYCITELKKQESTPVVGLVKVVQFIETVTMHTTAVVDCH